ncbi:acyltransferase [Sphingomonas aliaeris]|uniref:Acyltransferase n=1 Tax=Sphingomonas aliaeris TaxID=2759526 RepID=A0A974NX88_9SPHN|nr:acyltransferase [Sphingomonas aliaeris]QQV78558.1 acyltransferase [Sphingomonas aliaeris]
MSARPELRALTSVRGLAAWFVVLFHIRGSIAGLPPIAAAALAKGYLAVDFFFMLSGFVIWLSWSDTLRSGGLAAVPGFLHKRIARIWPLHLFVLGCTVGLVTVLLASGRHDGAEYPFDLLPLHVLLMHNWGFTDRLAWNDPSWSISAEMGAYLLFPLLTMAIDWRRVPTAAILGTVVALAIILNAVFAASGFETLGADIARFGLIRCLIEFSIGTAICALYLRWRDRSARPAIVAAVIGVGFGLLSYAGLPEPLALPLAFASLLLALALTSGMRANPLEGKALHYLGEISYATYLGHFVLFVVFKLVFVRDVDDIPVPLIGSYLLLVLITSILLYHGVERPAQRFVNALALPVFRSKARPVSR